MSPPGIAVRPHTLQNHAHRPCPREAPASRVPKLTVRASIIVQVPPPGAQQLRLGTENDAPPSSHVLRGEMLPASGMVAVVWAHRLFVCPVCPQTAHRLCARRARVGSPWGASERGSSSALRAFTWYPDPRADRTSSRAAASDPRRCVCEPFVGHFPRSLVGDFEGLDEAPRRF